MSELRFSGRSVPLAVVAAVTGKDITFWRAALQQGLMPGLGYAIKKKPNSDKFDYYVSPKGLHDLTGCYYGVNDNPIIEIEYRQDLIETDIIAFRDKQSQFAPDSREWHIWEALIHQYVLLSDGLQGVREGRGVGGQDDVSWSV